MTKSDEIFKLLGFAHRARKLTLGMTSTLRSLKKGRTQLLILAFDVSDNVQSKIRLAAKENRVAILTYGTKDAFGQLFGRNEVGIIGVDDAGFAGSLQEILR